MKNFVLMSFITASVLGAMSGNARAAAPPLMAVVGSSSGPQGSIDVDGATHVLYIGTNGHIIELFPSGSQWRWDDLTNLARAPLAATDEQVNSYVRSDGLTSVIYVSQSNHVMELTAGSRWVSRDVTLDAQIGGVTPNASSPFGYRRTDGTNAILWMPSSPPGNDIHEFDWNPTTHHYVDTNVSLLAGISTSPGFQKFHPFLRGDGASSVPITVLHSPNPGSGFDTGELFFSFGAWHSQASSVGAWVPTGFRRADNSTVMLSIAFGNNDEHVLQQLLTGSGWSAPADMTSISGGPKAESSVSGYERSDGLNVIVYPRFPDFHIEEIAFTGGAWHAGDLTQNAGAPAALGGGDLYPYVRADGVNSVPFATEDGHVYDLFLSGGAWHFLDLTVNATSA